MNDRNLGLSHAEIEILEDALKAKIKQYDSVLQSEILGLNAYVQAKTERDEIVKLFLSITDGEKDI
jgi:hypothetical protein